MSAWPSGDPRFDPAARPGSFHLGTLSHCGLARPISTTNRAQMRQMAKSESSRQSTPFRHFSSCFKFPLVEACSCETCMGWWQHCQLSGTAILERSTHRRWKLKSRHEAQDDLQIDFVRTQWWTVGQDHQPSELCLSIKSSHCVNNF